MCQFDAIANAEIAWIYAVFRNRWMFNYSLNYDFNEEMKLIVCERENI